MIDHETPKQLASKFPKTQSFANKAFICKIEYNLVKVFFNRKEDAQREAETLKKKGFYTKIVEKKSKTSVLPLTGYGVYKSTWTKD